MPSEQQLAFYAVQGCKEAVLIKRFQQVIERLDLKCTQGILIVCRHKDHDWHLFYPNRLDNAKAIDLRYLNIQKYDLRLELLDVTNCALAICGDAYHLHLRIAQQQPMQRIGCQPFIFDDQYLRSIHNTYSSRGLASLV